MNFEKSYCYQCDREMLIESELYHLGIANLQSRIHALCNRGHETTTLPVKSAKPSHAGEPIRPVCEKEPRK